MSNLDNQNPVALSNETILILCSVGFATLGIALFLILRNQPQHDDDDDSYGDVLEQRPDVATLNRAQRRARAKYKMKQARRDMAPLLVAARGGEGGGDNNMPADEGLVLPDVNDNFAVNRKERQRIAKQMERNERKIYAAEAQRWRDKNQASSKSDILSKKKKKFTSVDDNVDGESVSKEVSVETLFPRRLDNNDPLSDILFWETIVRSIKDTAVSTDELISRCLTAKSKSVTFREFIERVECGGSISIIDLADEFEISIPDALIEIALWNEVYNICGIVDSGYFAIIPLLRNENTSSPRRK